MVGGTNILIARVLGWQATEIALPPQAKQMCGRSEESTENLRKCDKCSSRKGKAGLLPMLWLGSGTHCGHVYRG